MGNAQVITIEISKCYNSVISAVEAQGARANEGVTRETFWRKRPECGCWCRKEGSANNEEEKRKASWRPKSPVREHSHRCMHMKLQRQRPHGCWLPECGSHNVTRLSSQRDRHTSYSICSPQQDRSTPPVIDETVDLFRFMIFLRMYYTIDDNLKTPSHGID